jgi:hypothetical protein
MNRLHEAGAVVGLGMLSYGLMHLLPPVDREVQRHDAAVEACASNLGGIGQYVEVLPADCDEFASSLDTSNLGGITGGPDAPKDSYYLPLYNEFLADFTYTPNQINDLEDMYQSDAVVMGLCASVVALGVVRWRGYIKAEGGEAKKPAPKPAQPRVQLNEDSPEWLEWARKNRP